MATQATAEDTAMMTRQEFSSELAPTAGVEAAKQEIQGAIVLAKRFPRDENTAYGKIIKSCKRPTFAEDVEYAFPRGGKTITGPSIYLAREFARLWGNIRHGCDIVSDTDAERTIRAWAWDLETNVKVSSDATFKKLIQRKQKNGTTQWVQPDERDLRELTNKHAALAKRNCLLELLPSDMVDDACQQARKTLKENGAKDPDELRKTLITAFTDLNVPITSLEEYLGHPLGQSSPDELTNLRSIYKSIRDGNSTWADYTSPERPTQQPNDAPKVITEEQRKTLVEAAKGNTQRLSEIVKESGFELIADITVEKYDAIFEKVAAVDVPEPTETQPEPQYATMADVEAAKERLEAKQTKSLAEKRLEWLDKVKAKLGEVDAEIAEKVLADYKDGIEDATTGQLKDIWQELDKASA